MPSQTIRGISRAANALPFSGVGAAKPAPRFYTMSLRRPHPLQRLVRRLYFVNTEARVRPVFGSSSLWYPL
jgi:hypothetical protein